MYKIAASTRRVTQYIKEEAYAWLYKKIRSNEYSANRSKAGKELLLRIEEQQKVTKKTYDEFIKLFEPSPFAYMMYRSKRRFGDRITTDHLLNYFVEYNGAILPIGFVQEFFEDDYETKAEVDALLNEFGNAAREEIGTMWKRVIHDKRNEIDDLQKKHPAMLKPHPTFVITNVVKLAITVALIVFLVIFMNEVQFIDVMKSFMFDNGFDINAEITATQTLSSYLLTDEVFCAKGDVFTLADYFSTYFVYFAVNWLIFFVVISRIKKAISFLIFIVRLIVNNITIASKKWSIQILEKNGLNSLSDYFAEIVPQMVEAREILDEFCVNIPKIKHTYISVKRYNVAQVIKKLDAQREKYDKKKFTYDPKNIKIYKSIWRKGIAWPIIYTVLLAIMNVPALFRLVILPIADVLMNLM